MTRQMSDQVDGWPDMPASQSANNTICLKFLVYSMVYSGPTWLVNLLATKHSCFVNYSAGENHSLLFNLVDLRPNKEMSGNLANWLDFSWWLTVIIKAQKVWGSIATYRGFEVAWDNFVQVLCEFSETSKHRYSASWYNVKCGKCCHCKQQWSC